MIYLILIQMAKSWYLAVTFSLLWPCFSACSSANTKEKELRKEIAEKDQQIMELIKEKVKCQTEMSKFEDMIKNFQDQVINNNKNITIFKQGLEDCKASLNTCKESKEFSAISFIIIILISCM